MNGITLELVDIDYKIIKKRANLMAIVSFSSSLCLLFPYLVPRRNFTWYHAMIVTLPPIIILIYYFITSNKINYKLNGTISIDDSKIIISQDSKEETFILKDIKQIKIIYHAYDEWIFPEIKKQIDQFWIEIEIEGKFYIYNYIVENKYKFKFLIDFLKSFRQKENVKVYNHAKLLGLGMNKITGKELKKEYNDLVANKLKRLKTTSANTV